MKQLLFLLLFPCLALAQYQGNANQKITLGEQTTADGLVYRGVASIDTVTATSKITRANKQDTSAFLLLDTTTNLLWHYKTGSNAWTQAGGGTAVTSITGGTGLTGGTITSTGTLAADTSFLFTQSDTLSLNLSNRFAAKQNNITLTTTGTSGAATLTGATLNIPQYSGGGGVDSTAIKYVNTYGTQTVNGAKTLTSNLILKNSQEPSRSTVVSNQTFAADTTNWTRGTGWTFNGTQAVATAATGDLTYTPSLTITSGNGYEITYTLTGYTGGTLTVRIGNVNYALPTHDVTGNVILLLPTSATGGFRFTTTTFTGSIDNVSVVQIINAAPVLFAGQDDGSATLYNSLRMPNSTTIAFGGGGSRTTGINNNFIGQDAGQSNTTGDNNNFIGTFSGLANTTGRRNNFFGYTTGYSNTTGENNNFFGYTAGFYNTTGYQNNFFGYTAGQRNTTGINNNFFGNAAGFENTTGNENNFFGPSAGTNNTTGFRNNFFGASAGSQNTTGSGNDFFGNAAGINNTTGFANMFFGQNSGAQTGSPLTGSNNISFGTNSGDNISGAATNNTTIGVDIDLPIGTGSNQLVIKNIIFATGASGSGTTIAGSVGIGTNAPTAGYRLTVADSVYVGGNVSASAYTTRSDYDLKDEIQNINYGLNEVMQMQPVKYTYKSNGSTQLGFIAQDLGVITPEVVSFEDKMSVYYNALIPILTKAIQEQQALIKALEQRILILENK